MLRAIYLRFPLISLSLLGWLMFSPLAQATPCTWDLEGLRIQGEIHSPYRYCIANPTYALNGSYQVAQFMEVAMPADDSDDYDTATINFNRAINLCV